MSHYYEQREAVEKKILKDWDAGASAEAFAISLSSTGWYDYEKQTALALPPIDENCQYTLTGNSWFDCTIVSHNRLVINCHHVAEKNEFGNGLQCFNRDEIQFRPKDFDKNSKLQGLPVEVRYHLSNIFNELSDVIRLLPAEDPRHVALVKIARAVTDVREVD